MSVVVLEKAFNLKMLLCYIIKPCSVASQHCKGPFQRPKEKNYASSSPANKMEVKTVSLYDLRILINNIKTIP